jgi:hypothetical protein
LFLPSTTTTAILTEWRNGRMSVVSDDDGGGGDEGKKGMKWIELGMDKEVIFLFFQSYDLIFAKTATHFSHLT